MSIPRISIVIRTYNRPQFLREALESVAAQTFGDFETLVVNDGGADVADVVRPLGEKARVRYLNLEDKVGRCAAANLAIRDARGELIAYLDDDDLYHPHHLETHVEFLDRHKDLRVSYSDAYEAVQRRRPDGTYETVDRQVKLSQDFHPMRFFAGCYIHIVTFVHARECVDRAGAFDESLEVLEDFDLFFRLAQDYVFGHINKVTAEYRIRDDRSNAITALRPEFVRTRERLFQKYFHTALPFLVSQYLERESEMEGLKAEVARLRSEIESLRNGRSGGLRALFGRRQT
jgi:glycosyltransferase involved in cell wall biosynthesis